MLAGDLWYLVLSCLKIWYVVRPRFLLETYALKLSLAEPPSIEIIYKGIQGFAFGTCIGCSRCRNLANLSCFLLAGGENVSYFDGCQIPLTVGWLLSRQLQGLSERRTTGITKRHKFHSGRGRDKR